MSEKHNQCKKCGHNCHCNWDQCDCGCDVCDCATLKEDIPSTFVSPTNTATP